MKLKMKQLLPCVLVVLSSSSFVYAQTAPAPDALSIDTKGLKKSIEINIIFPGRTELYRGTETAPSLATTSRSLPRKIKASIPFLNITNASTDVSTSQGDQASSPLEEAVKKAFDSVQQSLLQAEDAATLYSSMVPRSAPSAASEGDEEKDKDKDKIIGYSFNRSGLEMLESAEKATVRAALQSDFSDFESFFDNLLQSRGYMIDLDQIGIADSRKFDSSKVEVPGELDSVVGSIFKGEKIENSDDYQWRLNLNQYTLRIQIRLKKKINQ